MIYALPSLATPCWKAARHGLRPSRPRKRGSAPGVATPFCLVPRTREGALHDYGCFSNSVALGSSTISSFMSRPFNAARKPATFPSPETTHSACFAFWKRERSGPLARAFSGILS